MQKIQISDLRVGDKVLKIEGANASLPSSGVDIEKEEQIDLLKSKGIKYVYVQPSYSKEAFEEKVNSEPEKKPKTKNLKAITSAMDFYYEGVKIIIDVFKQAKSRKSLDLDDYDALVDRIVDLCLEGTAQLTGIIKLHEDVEYIYSHAMNMGLICGSVGARIGMDKDELTDIVRGSMVHDIGKVLVNEKILYKKGELTEQEFAMMATHVDKAYKILKLNGFSETSLKVVTEHHERIDGSGYPKKKKGEGISIYGKIGAIADTYDAMTSKRGYKPLVPENAALKELVKLAGTKLDKNVFQAFVSVIGIYPSGSIVLMSSNDFAAIGKQNKNKPSNPIVLIFMNTKGVKKAPFLQDTSVENIKARKIVKPVHFNNFKLPKEVVQMIAEMSFL